MITRGIRTAFLVLAAAIVVAIPLQVFFAGVGVFGGGFDVHRTSGDTILLATILLFLLSLAGWMRRDTFKVSGRGSLVLIGHALALMVVGHLQYVFLSFRGLPWVAALHALNSFAILGLALAVVLRSLRERGRVSAEQGAVP